MFRCAVLSDIVRAELFVLSGIGGSWMTRNRWRGEPRSQTKSDVTKATAKPGTDIPCRALLPKGLEGILAGGRCASMTTKAACGVRAQGTVMELGEGAGVAAAQAITTDCPVENVVTVYVRDGTTSWRV